MTADVIQDHRQWRFGDCISGFSKKGDYRGVVVGYENGWPLCLEEGSQDIVALKDLCLMTSLCERHPGNRLLPWSENEIADRLSSVPVQAFAPFPGPAAAPDCAVSDCAVSRFFAMAHRALNPPPPTDDFDAAFGEGPVSAATLMSQTATLMTFLQELPWPEEDSLVLDKLTCNPSCYQAPGDSLTLVCRGVKEKESLKRAEWREKLLLHALYCQKFAEMECDAAYNAGVCVVAAALCVPSVSQPLPRTHMRSVSRSIDSERVFRMQAYSAVHERPWFDRRVRSSKSVKRRPQVKAQRGPLKLIVATSEGSVVRCSECGKVKIKSQFTTKHVCTDSKSTAKYSPSLAVLSPPASVVVCPVLDKESADVDNYAAEHILAKLLSVCHRYGFTTFSRLRPYKDAPAYTMHLTINMPYLTFDEHMLNEENKNRKKARYLQSSMVLTLLAELPFDRSSDRPISEVRERLWRIVASRALKILHEFCGVDTNLR